MSIGRVVGSVVALVLIGVGAFLWSAGMGWVGSSGDTSSYWANIGGGLAGLGLALGFVVVRSGRDQTK
ncbi:MAG TPA: hypothetical protein VJ872_20215 [Nocardioides sp.]|nr:hypothetical protein [Nocardioides sp.]